MTSPYLTIPEAANYARVSVRTIRRAIVADALRYVGNGHLTRIRPEWVDQWLEQRSALDRQTKAG
jgi:excisionase family DNA binding protein